MAKQTSVLIVDDDPDVCVNMAHRLEGMSYATRTAHRQALTDVDLQLPDIIILDVRMRGIDGIAVMTELKKKETTRNIPVIMLSASGLDRRRAFAAGAKYFARKPYRGSELIAAIDAALDADREPSIGPDLDVCDQEK